tara:strand:- start:1106 stop:2356 length:1251 start_codon:yes stop_codon:yes gene_type:complete
MIKSIIINILKVSVTLVIIAIGILGYLWLKSTEENISIEKVEETSFFVKTSSIQINNYNPTNISFGSIFSSRQANLTFPLFGEVLNISDKFKSGEFVKKGTVLAELDNFNQLINLNDLEIQLSLNKSQIEEIKSEISTDKLQLQELLNQLDIREKQKARIISMVKSKASTDSALDEILLAVSIAKSNILSRKQNINRLNFKIEQLNLSNKRLKMTIKKAKRGISDTILKAPFDGSLGNVNIALGENVSNQKIVASLSNLNFLEVSFNVPSQVFANFQDVIGKEVSVYWEQGSDEVSMLKGYISRRDAYVNPQDGGGKMFAILPKPSANFSKIPPGAFVKVYYPIGSLLKVAKLPEEAIYEGDSIFVIKDGRALKKKVQIIHKEPGFVYFKGDITNGEKVVVSRLAGIGDGIKLESK